MKLWYTLFILGLGMLFQAWLVEIALPAMTPAPLLVQSCPGGVDAHTWMLIRLHVNTPGVWM